jgi:cleavage stimulation factor subunit 3
MEYHCNTDANIATKIFELGLKAFPDDVSFAVKFLEFLIQINDDSSEYWRAQEIAIDFSLTAPQLDARALFERLVLKFPADKARPIWDAWSKHEYLYGDLAASQTLEARLKEIYQNGEYVVLWAR